MVDCLQGFVAKQIRSGMTTEYSKLYIENKIKLYITIIQITMRAYTFINKFLYGVSRANPDDFNRQSWKYLSSRNNTEVPCKGMHLSFSLNIKTFSEPLCPLIITE